MKTPPQLVRIAAGRSIALGALAGILLTALVLAGGAGATQSTASARISAHLTKTTLMSSEVGSVKLIYRFSKPSKSFAFRLTIKNGDKWQQVRRVKTVKKTRAFRGPKSIALETLFRAKPVRAGSYRLRLSVDGGSKLLAFRVIGLGMIASPLSAGGDHTCAVVAGGRVKCWGANYSGQLGDGTKTNRTSAVAVRGISTAVQVSAGLSFTCALLTDRTVRCWGADNDFQLGDGKTTDSATPSKAATAGAVQISAGGRHTCALLADGTVECWGGDLGEPALKVSGISRAVQVSSGLHHYCALLADRTIECWGANFNGQLGNGTLTDSSTPVRVKGISNAIQVSAGRYHTCALLASGAIECWGGTGLCIDWCTDPAEKIWGVTPTPLIGISKAIELSDRNDTCALVSGGKVTCWDWVWGSSSRVPDPVLHVSGISGATDVSSGDAHDCVRISDGSARCWGNNYYGQLGNGTTGEWSSTPVKVIGLP